MKSVKLITDSGGNRYEGDQEEDMTSILEYYTDYGYWVILGDMMIPRSGHAVSVSNLDLFWKFCSESQ